MSNELLNVQIDVTELATYLEKVKEIPSVSKPMAGVFLRDFILGQDIANTLLAKAVQTDIKAKAALEQAEAVAFLENASDYLKSKDIKFSAEAAKKYVDIDQDVIRAKDKKAQTEALVALLKGKLSILRQAHDDLKKITYGDQHMTDYVG